MTSSISASQSIKNKGTSLALDGWSFSLAISFQFSIRSTCLSQFCFVCVHMNCLGFRILIPFFRSVTLSRITCLFFATTSNSHLSISISFHCASTIAPMWIVVFPPALLWIVVLPPQQCSPPLHPSMLSMLPQSVVP